MAKKRKPAGDPRPLAGDQPPAATNPAAAAEPRVGSIHPSLPEVKEIRHPDGRIEHPSVHFEPRDVSFRGVVIVIVLALVVGMTDFGVVWWFFSDREHHEDQTGASRYPLEAESTGDLPPNPRLEQLDRLAGIRADDFRRLELATQRRLESYGETSEEGYIHIPIARAMELAVDRLPARKSAEAARASYDRGLVDGGESNSGRMFREARP
ncbi:MAG TPA: hypothetical protein VHV08_12995 [Pirellulales bacterium]|jgi:hypothetical protein|nr:hypothetical protein [Pirellulales bacterium]